MSDSLGLTGTKETVASAFASNHSFRVKLVSATQLSSMLIISMPSPNSSIILIAYYYLRTRHRSEFAWASYFLDIRNFIFKSYFMKFFTLSLSTSMPWSFLTYFDTILTFKIDSLLSSILCIVYLTIDSFFFCFLRV